ncbi:MAG TPA: ATP-binding protein [Chitinispirillaceae bacterium]|nr:ATP-binding protein [Chitinispirillaceae bacterium]
MKPEKDSHTRKSLSNQDELYLLALNSNRECMLILDKHEHIIFSNDSVEKLFNLHKEDILGKKFSRIFLNTVPEDQVELIISEGMERGWDGECLMESVGEIFPALLSISTMSDEQGTQGLLVVIRDITRGKRTICHRMHLEKMRALGEMISSVAHDLNNPLASVVGYAELLEEQIKATHGNISYNQLLEEVHIINYESRRASRIVQNLLTYIRNDESEREPLDINTLLNDTLKVFQRSIADKEIRITIDFNTNLPLVYGDSYMLQQVFMNILVNAYHAIKNTQNSGEIHVTTNLEDSAVMIHISDNGCGISPDILDNIFEPFFTTKKPGLGTGLGLSIANGIITNHEGSIKAMNNPNGGATFTIKLPKTKQRQRPKLEPVEVDLQTRENLKGMRVLVVDDEAGICTLAQKVLSHIGIGQVDTAKDGAEALKRMERFTYNLVITDVKMPVMNGMELYQNAQENERLQHIPFIFITGNLLCNTTEEFLRRYKIPFIHKPFAVASMAKIVEMTLTQDIA